MEKNEWWPMLSNQSRLLGKSVWDNVSESATGKLKVSYIYESVIPEKQKYLV